jgi:putative ABC transport system substrate-binding protein
MGEEAGLRSGCYQEVGMRRRHVVLLALWCGAAIPGYAQEAPRPPLVGVMMTGGAADTPVPKALREELAARGDVEGRNLRLAFRFADGDARRFPAMAEAFVREKASVIVVFSEAGAHAAEDATRTIPIVAVVEDFVAKGLGASLGRPGGNITGVTMISPALDAKRLEILHEMLPAARRLAVLSDRTVVSSARLQSMKDAAQELGVELRIVEIDGPDDLDTAFETLRAGGAMMFNLRDRLGALASVHRLPAMCGLPEMAAVGCLASYGIPARQLYAEVADLTHKVLKGASPADTPARQPTKFELVINRNTARALGIGIPPSLVARADEVIE